MFSRAASPRSHHNDIFTEKSRHIDSASVSPSVHSSEERPRSRATSQLSRPQSQPSRSGKYD